MGNFECDICIGELLKTYIPLVVEQLELIENNTGNKILSESEFKKIISARNNNILKENVSNDESEILKNPEIDKNINEQIEIQEEIEELKDIYKKFASSKNPETRLLLYYDLLNAYRNNNMDSDAISKSLYKVIENIDKAQQNDINTLIEEYKSAQNPVEALKLAVTLNNANVLNTIEINSYNIRLGRYESKLPSEKIENLSNIYRILSSVKREEDRNKLLKVIEEKQKEYQLDEYEMKLSNEQVNNAVLTSICYELGSLFEDLIVEKDVEKTNEIKDRIKTLYTKAMK